MSVVMLRTWEWGLASISQLKGQGDAKVILNSADAAGIRLELIDPLDTP
jgi:hypothetical protein